MKRPSLLALLALSTLLALPPGAPLRADDIDIYDNPSASSSDAPVVMFTLDWRPNLASTVCGSNSCSFLTSQSYVDANGVSHPYLTLTNGSAAFFDLLRASLVYVIQQVGSSGVRIGLAISHNQGGGSTCAGPQSSGSKCTNGGYILSGAAAMTTQAQRDAFYAKLYAIPVPQGNASHPYQGPELFFELYRYFSSQGWYNMQNGWTDYGTKGNYDINQTNFYTSSNGWSGGATTGTPLSWDASIVNGSNYVSPLNPATDSCPKLFTVNIMFQVSQQDTDSNSAIIASTGSGGMGPAVTQSGHTLNYTSAVANNTTFSGFPAVISWMHDNNNDPAFTNAVNVISYFIVDSTKVNATTESFAGAGVGKPSALPYTLSNDPQTLISTLTDIFRNILSVSTTFVAPSVAVNVYNRSQVLNDVFIAMFQVNSNGFPAWPGDIKKFTIGLDPTSQTSQLQDVTGINAVASDGRIRYGALSYWTIQADLPAATTNTLDYKTGDDGRDVSRGGAGSKIPGFELHCNPSYLTDTSCYPGNYTPGMTNPTGTTINSSARMLFYDDPSVTMGANAGLSPLNATVATATALQSLLGGTSVGTCTNADTDPTSACNLLTYARGLTYDASGVLRARPWIMNDVLHSHPLAVNYGARPGSGYTTSNPDVRVIAGTNDGFLHMFHNTKAGQTSETTPNDTDGVESWAFMPRELIPIIHRLYTNQTNVLSPPHPYALDGTPTVYMLDVNGDGNIDPTSCTTISGTSYCDKVYLYFGLRRGGSAYYALDITDPDNPKFLWKITPTTNASGQASTDFAQMGQSWSTPKIGQMLFNGNTVSRPVLIFGGGYDTNKDTHPGHYNALGVPYTSTAIGTDDSHGNAIFIVDAQTGALVWKAIQNTNVSAPGTYVASDKAWERSDMADGIPSDVTIVDSDGNGLIDRIYVGDTGGRLWRVDTPCANQDGTGCPTTGPWKVSKILSVGRHVYGQLDLADDRRFFYAPAYVQSQDANGPFDAVIIGAGDRENPKDTSVTNWFYMFKDRNTTSGNPPSSLVLDSALTDLTCDGTTNATCQSVGSYGWRMRLECPPTDPSLCGEKSLSSPLTQGNDVIFTTYIPPTSNTGSGSCSLQEGSGLTYEVNLLTAGAEEDFDPSNDTATQKYFKSDRYIPLASAGIPSEPVALGGGQVLWPDLSFHKANVKLGYRTYWYDRGR